MEISLSSLVANARTVQARAGGARLLPMVKADAYGLGAVPVARVLERQADPWGFGVATIPEGAALRAAGISRPIVVFTPARPEQRHEYHEHALTAVLDHPATVARWTTPFHLEIDTGMGRSGIRWDDPAIAGCGGPHLQGAFMHFHSAEDNPHSVEVQWNRFERALAALGTRPALVHAANTAAVWHFGVSLDLVRPGIFLYGCRPAPDLPEPAPVAGLYARVVSLRRIPAGDSVSYGAEWVAPRNTTVATIGFGYADGLSRRAQGRGHVLLRGRRVPLVGRITMDMVMAEAGPDPGALAVGDRATLVGRDGAESITWDDWAEWAGTNTYEVMSRIGPRVQRVYPEPGSAG
jgi:alanine racemase